MEMDGVKLRLPGEPMITIWCSVSDPIKDRCSAVLISVYSCPFVVPLNGSGLTICFKPENNLFAFAGGGHV
jgi:hypothetical protein